MSIPREVVEEVLARTDLAALVGQQVTLRRNGRNYVGLCPFHQEKSPSFNVLPQKGIYHCFGCGEGGDAIQWLRKTRGMSFVEAVKELAGPAGIQIAERELSVDERKQLSRKHDLHGACELACSYFHQTLLTAPEGAPGRAYLERRGVSLETARKYRLGYAPEGWTRLADHLSRQGVPLGLALEAGLVKQAERASDRGARVYDTFRNRLLFPILDDRERPLAFGGRLLEGEGPKYLNSPESPIYEKSKALYGLCWARTAIQRRDRVIVVEGYFDAVSLWQAGFTEAVATCGTALTPHHVEALRRMTRKAVALFDADEAGVRAASKSIELFVAAEMSASRLDLGDAKDPDEFIQRYGGPAFEERLGRAEPLLDMVIRRVIQQEGTDLVAPARAMERILPLLRSLPEGPRDKALLDLAGRLGLPAEDLRGRMARPADAPAAPRPSAAPTQRRWIPTKELSHLIWLVMSFPTLTAPALYDADPDCISPHPEVLDALHRFAQGEGLPAVLDAVPDEELRNALRAIGARDAGYTEQNAARAARALVARLEIPHIEARIRVLGAEVVGAVGAGDTIRAAALSREVKGHQERLRELRARVIQR